MAPMVTTFVILGITFLLFLSDRIRLDLVAVLTMLALGLTGVVTPEEAVAGLSSSVVVMLAGLFVIGGALMRTGVANSLGEWLVSQGGASPTRLLVTIMLVAAVLSAFMSSTGTVAILIPAVMGVAQRTGVSHSKLLMPLAYGCLIGGMLTLIGTPPNLVVQEALEQRQLPGFGFFSYAPMGLVALLLALGYMVTIGFKMLPVNEQPGASSVTIAEKQLAVDYEVTEHLFTIELAQDSPLCGETPEKIRARPDFGVNFLGMQRHHDEELEEVDADTVFEPGSILHLHGHQDDLKRFAANFNATLAPPLESYKEVTSKSGLAELLLTPRSRLLGSSLRRIRFEERFKVNVVSLARMGKLLEHDIAGEPLRFGDTLLVAGRYDDLLLLNNNDGNFVVVGLPPEAVTSNLRREKAPVALALVALMLLLMSSGLLPSMLAVMLVAALAVLFRCLSMEDAYRSISWESLLLVAGMLPIATALEKTGGMALISQSFTSSLGGFGPTAVMTGLFLLTSIFSQFVSNTATTVLVAPVAIMAAGELGVSPQAFLMAVAVGASAAFVTPVASPVNTLVLGPGGYRFMDFVKVGLPLQLALAVAASLLLPMFFPF